jgi:ankyrin repeat protein
METPLHRAAYWAKKDIVDLLLNAKADSSISDACSAADLCLRHALGKYGSQTFPQIFICYIIDEPINSVFRQNV